MENACESASAAVAAGQLISGVGLHDPQGLLRTSPDRLTLSSGTRPVGSLGLSGYRDTAFIPRGPWREPSNLERRLLLAAEPPVNIGAHVTVIRAPDEVLMQFDELRDRVHHYGSADDVRSLLLENPCAAGCDAMMEFARTYLRSEQPLIEVGSVACKATGLPTSTTDDTGTYVGLHLDNWYRAELDARENAPNRISINLGTTARYFLYINLPLAAIGALTFQQCPSDSRIHDTQHGLRAVFMSHFRAYPVVRIRLDPGEGYIAPTENLIHDGTTPGEHGSDIQYRVRGRFWPPASNT
jgi:hypothetical protein